MLGTAKLMLAMIVLTGAVAKLLTGYADGLAVSRWVYWIIMGFELALVASMLSSRLAPYALVGVSVLAGAGVVLSMFTTKNCGCFGSRVQLSMELHLAVAGTTGLIAMMCLYFTPAKRTMVRIQQGG